MTMARTIKLYKVPDQPQLPGIRAMTPKDGKRVFELVSAYLKKFPLHPEFAEVCSFYSLPSSILGHEKYTVLKAAYSYWNVATTVPLHELMYDALIFARQRDFDVFNALNVMENDQFLKELKFGIGDGFL